MTKKEFTRETFVRKFFRESNLPFPVQRENFLPYYSKVKGFESAKDSFVTFINYVESIGYENYIKEKDVVEEAILYTIKNNSKYKEFIETKIDNAHYTIKVTKNLYEERFTNRKLISFDLKNANFYVLYKLGIVPTSNWKEWVKTFTDNEFIGESRSTRQIILGKLNNKRIENVMKSYMINYVNLANSIISKNNVVVLNKDEIVYDVTDTILSHDNLTELESIFENCHMESFVLEKTLHGFAKKYDNGEVTFHAVSRNYWLENYKDYYDLPLETEDFFFLDNDRCLCQRLETIAPMTNI